MKDSLALLLRELQAVRDQLARLRLPLELPEAQTHRSAAAATLRQLEDYLLPRVGASAAPLLAVVGGSTGAGKSTLVNSLLGERVTVPGVLRPTTRSPVLVHHPADADWFSGDRILPSLARGGAATAASLELVASDAVPRGLALLDAPDVDSVVVENRELAVQLLAAADLWLFATTAARYADAVPWDLLHDAARRHTQVALILGRVDPGSEVVAVDLHRMLDQEGLAEAPVFVIPEQLDQSGLLPAAAVGPLARWLTHLTRDEDTRMHVIEATRDGVVDDVVARTRELAHAVDAQQVAADSLDSMVRAAFDRAQHQVDVATSDGTLLRGEVLARWQDFVGTGEFFRSVEQHIGKVRDAVTGFFRGSVRKHAAPTQQAISHSLEAVIVDAIQGAAEGSIRSWRGDAAGAALLQAGDPMPTTTRLRPLVGEQIRNWQADVLQLVGEQAAGRRGKARALSFGVNGLGLSLMVVVFASTGGLTGAEVGIAGGTAVLAQRVLEGVFGEDAVRRLTRIAHSRLSERIEKLLESERALVLRPLAALELPAVSAELDDAATAVETAASSERKSRRNTPQTPQQDAGDGAAQDESGHLRGLAAPSSCDEPGRAV